MSKVSKIVVLVLIAGIALASAAGAESWNLFNTFSLASNVNGPFTYGTAVDPDPNVTAFTGYAFNPFTFASTWYHPYFDEVSSWSTPIPQPNAENATEPNFWYAPFAGTCNRNVYIFQAGKFYMKAFQWNDDHWALPHDGYRTMVRFIAPEAASYTFTGLFGDMSDGPQAYSMTVNGSSSIFNGMLDGANANINQAVVLNGGDTVDFIIGASPNWYMSGASFCYLDLDVSSTPVPEPGSMLALGSGLLGLAGFAIRRRK
jgi:hypothetical protein